MLPFYFVWQRTFFNKSARLINITIIVNLSAMILCSFFCLFFHFQCGRGKGDTLFHSFKRQLPPRGEPCKYLNLLEFFPRKQIIMRRDCRHNISSAQDRILRTVLARKWICNCMYLISLDSSTKVAGDTLIFLSVSYLLCFLSLSLSYQNYLCNHKSIILNRSCQMLLYHFMSIKQLMCLLIWYNLCFFFQAFEFYQ